MTSPALLMIVASVVSVQGPMAQIDLGQSDGLIEGVGGQVYYELTVAGQPKRIDVGRATVTAVEEATATIRLAATRPLYPGQRVEFEIAQPQPSSADRYSIDRASMDQSTAPVVLDESSSVADVVDSETKIEPATEPLEVKLPLEANPPVQPPDQPAGAATSTDAPAMPPIAVTTIATDSITAETITTDTIAMTTIDGGAQWVGLDPGQAEFFNQTPRFATEIDPYRIDLEPVSDGPGSDGSASDRSPSTLRGVTYGEAERHCDQRGARLPTEIEWEVAATQGQLDFVEGLLEWTASWYQPYPGNTNNEAEYGQRFRVLRGSPAGAILSPHDRRFMAPGERNSQVGFRCVEETP